MSILRTIGIDISKDWLDVFAAPEGRASRLSNDAAGFRKLIAWIGPEVDRIAYEPTGPFHRDLEDTLLKAGLPLYAINPFQVRSFARSLGRRAKTDAVDARMLATMAAAVEDLRPAQARSEGQRDLAELQQIRDALLVFSILGCPRLICRSESRGGPDCWAPAEASVASRSGCPTGTGIN